MIADSAAQMRAAGFRIVGNAGRHQKAADIGVAQAQRAEIVGALRDFLATGIAPSAPRFRARRSTAAPRARSPRRRSRLGLAGSRNVQQVQRREIAGRVVEEHVFRARIRGDDRARGRAGVPVVDGGVELQAGIGAGPGGVADLLPQIARLHGLGDLAVLGAPEQIPVAVGFDGLEESSVMRTVLLEFWPETVR